jgi:hypothetical protein
VPKKKKKYHNKTKTQPFSVSEGIHFFSSPDDIHTQEKKGRYHHHRGVFKRDK